jgi:cation diffusion facilitator family transporter
VPGTAEPAWREAGRRGARWALLGTGINLVLVLTKITVGVVGNSYALIADGVESATDVFGSLIVWRGMVVARRSATEQYPFGYGRAETLAAAAVAMLLLGAAAGIAIQAVREIHAPHHGPESYTLAVLLGVIALKELMFRRFRAAGAELGSRALETDAWHHRSDAITSAAAFAGISMALIGGPAWAPADDWAALFASVVIAVNGIRLLRPSVGDLMDRSAEPAVVARFRETALRVDGVRTVEKVHARRMGLGYRVVIHVQADPGMTLRDAHNLGGRVRSALRDTGTVIDAIVHMEPWEAPAVDGSGAPERSRPEG